LVATTGTEDAGFVVADGIVVDGLEREQCESDEVPRAEMRESIRI
jgi:hypothetical protein